MRQLFVLTLLALISLSLFGCSANNQSDVYSIIVYDLSDSDNNILYKTTFDSAQSKQIIADLDAFADWEPVDPNEPFGPCKYKQKYNGELKRNGKYVQSFWISTESNCTENVPAVGRWLDKQGSLVYKDGENIRAAKELVAKIETAF